MEGWSPCHISTRLNIHHKVIVEVKRIQLIQPEANDSNRHRDSLQDSASVKFLTALVRNFTSLQGSI